MKPLGRPWRRIKQNKEEKRLLLFLFVTFRGKKFFSERQPSEAKVILEKELRLQSYYSILEVRMHEKERMNEVVFEVVQEADGGLVAECLTESIFTQADSWSELRRNVKEAVEAYFFDKTQPLSIRLHLVRDETLAMA